MLPLHRKNSTEEAEDLWKQQQINWLRWLTPISLMCMAVIFGVGAYYVGDAMEKRLSESEFDAIRDSMGHTLTTKFQSHLDILLSLKASVGHECPHQSDWPNCSVSISTYQRIFDPLMNIGNQRSLGYGPILSPDQVSAFEEYAYDFYESEGYPDLGISDFGEGIYANDEDGNRYHDNEAPTHGSHNILLPNFVAANIENNSKAIMLNIYSQESTYNGVDRSLNCSLESIPANNSACRCYSISDVMWLIQDGGLFRPAAAIYYPLLPENEDHKSEVTGIGYVLFNWDALLSNSIPRYINGLEVVLQHGGGEMYTYKLEDEVASFKGVGQQFTDSRLSSRGKKLDVTILDEFEWPYVLMLVPTYEYDMQYRTNGPIFACLFSVFIVMLTSGLFFLYDHMITRGAREKELVINTRRLFVRYISHEVRTPLNTIQLALDIIASELKKTIEGLMSSEAWCNEDMCRRRSNDSKKIIDENNFENIALAEKMKGWLQWITEVDESSQSAVVVFNDLLNYDKITNGCLDVEYVALNPLDLVNTAIHPFFVQARQGGVKLEVDIEDRLHKVLGDYSEGGQKLYKPDASECTYPCVMGDNIKLGQVVKNLVSNALKFTPAGGNIAVSVTWDNEMALSRLNPGLNAKSSQPPLCYFFDAYGECKPAGTLIVSVNDSGAGLSKDNLKHLFKEGVQFDVNKLQAGGGSGLGLWICKGVVDLHCGEITANSDGIGRGSTFTLQLPMVFSKSLVSKAASRRSIHNRNASNRVHVENFSVHSGMSSARHDAPSCKWQERVLRILVVDDAKSNRRLVCHMLKSNGHICTEAEDGQQCLELFQKAWDFDLVLMDYEMPRMNGPEATKILRKDGVLIPIVGITGNVLSNDIEYFKEAGANEVLAKPLKREHLEDLLERVQSGEV